MDDQRSEAEVEAQMRQSLGLTDPPKPVVSGLQRSARQAIRSQAAARDYAERQLARAEQTIQDLRTKLHAIGRERGGALEAARRARAAQAQAEHGLRAAEVALMHEKAAAEHAQREAREARASVHDLRTKLALAHRTAAAAQTQLGQELQLRIAAEQALQAVQVSTAVTETKDAPEEQPVKRRRGSPPGQRDPSTPPRLTPKPVRKSHADTQEPVRWWTDDWKSAAS